MLLAKAATTSAAGAEIGILGDPVPASPCRGSASVSDALADVLGTTRSGAAFGLRNLAAAAATTVNPVAARASTRLGAVLPEGGEESLLNGQSESVPAAVFLDQHVSRAE
ncbi:hypothetical protein GCM10009565_84600 [Amycolatopsis albidoflavus]